MTQLHHYSTETSAQDRRGFDRVLDAVGLTIRKLEPGEVADFFSTGEYDLYVESDTPVTNEDDSLGHFAGLEELRKSHPQAALHIEALEKRLGIQSHKTNETPAAAYPTHKVSLSGSGIAFGHDKLLQPGDRIELGMTFFPSRNYVRALAVVISVGDSKGPALGGKYAARAVFSNMRSEVRDAILKHIRFVSGKM
ncbi:MAG: hypothetical protein KDJ38_12665 [Gammaproteobacteria bacterium]|nr:hypothetical protein [Gammaproteobacteria bacterium]